MREEELLICNDCHKVIGLMVFKKSTRGSNHKVKIDTSYICYGCYLKA